MQQLYAAGMHGMTMEKLFARLEIKAVDVPRREISGYAAVAGNKDRTGDVIDKGAFDRTLKENPDVLVFIGHDASRLPVGEPDSMVQDAKGLLTVTRVYNTPAGDELLEVARQRMASGKTLGMSIGYRTVKQRFVGNVRHLQDVDLMEYSFLASPNLAANPEATVTGMKGRKANSVGPVITTDDSYEELREDLAQAAAALLERSYVSVCATFSDHVVVAAYMDDDTHYWDIPYMLGADGEPTLGDANEVDPAFVPAAAKARATFPEVPPVKVMTAEQKAALPDVAFAFIEEGGTKDDGGLTTPRTKRHFAHHSADGQVDEQLLREAITAAQHSDIGSKALAHLERHARAAGISADLKADDAHAREWSEGAAPAIMLIALKLFELAENVAADRLAMERIGIETKGGARLKAEAQDRFEELIRDQQGILNWAHSVQEGEDSKARTDWYRSRLALLELEVPA